MVLANSPRVSSTIRMKLKSWLIYWGARIQQIANSFKRCDIKVCLAETVHASWGFLGGADRTVGGALLFDLTLAIRAQVSLICMICVLCMLAGTLVLLHTLECYFTYSSLFFSLKQSWILRNNCSCISLASTYYFVIMMISAVCLTVHARMYMLFLNENYNNSFYRGLAIHCTPSESYFWYMQFLLTIGISIDCTDVHASMYITEEVTWLII